MLELRPEWLAEIHRVLDVCVPGAEVWAYGSRVTGTAHEGSDLDLVLRNPAQLDLPTPGLSLLREAFSNSALPILVDVHDWATLPDSFRKRIEQAHEIVRSR